MEGTQAKQLRLGAVSRAQVRQLLLGAVGDTSKTATFGNQWGHT